MTAIPAEVRIAAQEAFARQQKAGTHTLAECLDAALEAAAPLIVSHRETATAAAIAKAERERLLAAVTRFKTVLGQPVNGYLVDAVPFAAILDVFAALPEGSRP